MIEAFWKAFSNPMIWEFFWRFERSGDRVDDIYSPSLAGGIQGH